MVSVGLTEPISMGHPVHASPGLTAVLLIGLLCSVSPQVQAAEPTASVNPSTELLISPPSTTTNQNITTRVFSDRSNTNQNTATAEPAVFDPLSSTYLLKLVFSLLLVLALMFVVVWLLKRSGRFNGRAGRYPLQVLTQMPIGTRERVLLIAVGDRQMLIGVAPGQIEALGWVDPPLQMDASANLTLPDIPFARLLQRQINRQRAKNPAGMQAEAGVSESKL